MGTIKVRRLDDNWDRVYGSGLDDFVCDKEAVAQIIQSRLRLWLGEWWENLSEGLPMFQKILGKKAASKIIIDNLIQKRIAGTPYVTGVASFSSELNIESRNYECSAIVDTSFGQIMISNQGE